MVRNEGPTEDGDPALGDEVSEQALATICLTIDFYTYGLVRNAKVAWDNLRNTYGHFPVQELERNLYDRRTFLRS